MKNHFEPRMNAEKPGAAEPQPGALARGDCRQIGRRVTNPPQVENLPHMAACRNRVASPAAPVDTPAVGRLLGL
jgi:hypothetical protein